MKISLSKAVLAVLFAAALFLHFTHLDGAMPSYTDENRTLHYTRFSPLLYVLCAPFTHSFQNYDMPFYVMAFFGTANILLLYLLTTQLFGKRIGVIAAFFYLIFDYPLAYTKLLYYSTPVTTFCLMSLIFFVLSAKRNNANYMILSGVSSGLMLMTNGSSYSLFLGVIVFFIACILLRAFNTAQISISSYVWRYAAGILIPCILIDPILMLKYPGRGWFQSLLNYRQVTLEIHSPKELGIAGVVWLWERAYQASLKGFSQIGRNLFILLTTIIGIMMFISRRNKIYSALFAMTITGAGVLFLGCGLSLHTIAPRHFVWTAVFVSITCALLFNDLLTRRSYSLRLMSILAVSLYAVFAVIQSINITTSLSSYNSIRSYLKDHRIPQTKLVTMLPLGSYKDNRAGDTPSVAPLIRKQIERNGKIETVFRIHWPAMITAYNEGLISHCLTSGYGSFKLVGDDDFMLKGVTPLMSWPHPLSNRFVHFAPENITINLYNMKDVYEHLVQKSKVRIGK